MAYGDIIPNDPFNSSSEYREKNGVETVNKAVVLKDASTKGSAAIDHLSDKNNLSDLINISAQNRAGIYVGTAGDLCVLLSGQSDPITTGTASATTSNKLVDDTKTFVGRVTLSGIHIQLRDIVVNTTDTTSAFVSAVDSGEQLSLVDVSNSASNIMASGENYEIYRAVLFQNIAAGSLLPIQVDRVFKLGTTADDIIALY
jgi:hypothetical protein